MERAEPGRRLRRGLILLLLVFGALLASSAGAQIWFYVSTRPEPRIDGTPANSDLANSGPFGFLPDLQGDVRVKRWGEHSEFRHGPFFAERNGRTLAGSYDRGSMSGRWQLKQGNEVILEGLGISYARESTDWVRGLLFGVEVEFQEQEDWWWRVPSLGIELSGESDLLLARKWRDGGFIVGPVDFIDVEMWDDVTGWFVSDESRVEFDAGGRLLRLHSKRLRTEFAAGRAIVRQEMIDRRGKVAETRTAPPWWDPVTGEESGEEESP